VLGRGRRFSGTLVRVRLFPLAAPLLGVARARLGPLLLVGFPASGGGRVHREDLLFKPRRPPGRARRRGGVQPLGQCRKRQGCADARPGVVARERGERGLEVGDRGRARGQRRGLGLDAGHELARDGDVVGLGVELAQRVAQEARTQLGRRPRVGRGGRRRVVGRGQASKATQRGGQPRDRGEPAGQLVGLGLGARGGLRRLVQRDALALGARRGALQGGLGVDVGAERGVAAGARAAAGRGARSF
jgi:hypothetical protein